MPMDPTMLGRFHDRVEELVALLYVQVWEDRMVRHPNDPEPPLDEIAYRVFKHLHRNALETAKTMHKPVDGSETEQPCELSGCEGQTNDAPRHSE